MNIEKIRDALAWAVALCETLRQQRGRPIDQEIIDCADAVDEHCRQLIDEMDNFDRN